MFGGRIPLFRLFDFSVHLDISWIIIALLVTWSLAAGTFPYYYKNLSAATYWWMGIIGAVGLFASIILHEMAHSLVARRFDMPIRGITLFVFGGVPAEILYDNMKNVVIKLQGTHVQWNAAFESFALHYGFKPRVTPPYAPWVKGKVERPIDYIRERFWRGYNYPRFCNRI